jgi:parvulin-like peptidyl-prolyl isomerase
MTTRKAIHQTHWQTLVQTHTQTLAWPVSALLLLLACSVTGCGTSGNRSAQTSDAGTTHQTSDAANTVPPATGTTPGSATGTITGKPLAYLDGQAISGSALLVPLLESSGGQVLSELVVGKALAKRLAEAGITLTPAMIENEKTILLKSLDPDVDQAQRLVNELRKQRGLGSVRWEQFLARQAGLRALVKDQATVSDAALKQEFALVYGARFEARLIVVPTLVKASELAKRARAGESFIDLAIAHSSDESRAQGGMLPSVSLVDATFPAAVRSALAALNPGDVSDPVSLEQGFALLKLERKIDAQQVQFDDVKAGLSERVRLNAERLLMLRLARTMLKEAQIVVMDESLRRSWDQQRRESSESSP